MKKFTVVVFALAALMTLGITACSSIPQLDLSTLDHSQPVPVRLIGLELVYKETQEGFFNKYGYGLKNPSDKLEKAEADKLLQILCGSVTENWESIVQRVKAETGITLDGSRFMQDLKNGDSRYIQSTEQQALYKYYSYSWQGGLAGDLEDTIALIGLKFDLSLGEVVPVRLNIQTFGELEADGMTKKISGKYSMLF